MSRNHLINIGISACLAGEPVRYDGSDKYIADLCEFLSGLFRIVPVCPELAAGMGVPRAPIQLVGEPETARALGVHVPSVDVTDQLADFARHTLLNSPDLDGFVVKARSPSCGLGTTPVFNQHQQQTGTGSGIFTRTLYNTDPTIPMIDESGIENLAQMDQFVLKVCVYSVFRRQVMAATDRQQAVQLFHRNISNIADLQQIAGLKMPLTQVTAQDADKQLVRYAQQLFELLAGDRLAGMLLTQIAGLSSAHFDAERVSQLLAMLGAE